MCRLLADAALTLNAKKCEFHKTKLKFFGHIFSDVGMTPYPAKVQALSTTSPPQDVSMLHSFLGMANREHIMSPPPPSEL